MFFAEFMKLLSGGIQFGGIWLAGQRNGADNPGILVFDPTTQIRQRSALPDKIVRHTAAALFAYSALEPGLLSQATVSGSTRANKRRRKCVH